MRTNVPEERAWPGPWQWGTGKEVPARCLSREASEDSPNSALLGPASGWGSPESQHYRLPTPDTRNELAPCINMAPPATHGPGLLWLPFHFRWETRPFTFFRADPTSLQLLRAVQTLTFLCFSLCMSTFPSLLPPLYPAPCPPPVQPLVSLAGVRGGAQSTRTWEQSPYMFATRNQFQREREVPTERL